MVQGKRLDFSFQFSVFSFQFSVFSFQFSVFSFQLKEWMLVDGVCRGVTQRLCLAAVSHRLCWLANGSERRTTKPSLAEFRPSRFHQLKTEN